MDNIYEEKENTHIIIGLISDIPKENWKKKMVEYSPKRKESMLLQLLEELLDQEIDGLCPSGYLIER